MVQEGLSSHRVHKGSRFPSNTRVRYNRPTYIIVGSVPSLFTAVCRYRVSQVTITTGIIIVFIQLMSNLQLCMSHRDVTMHLFSTKMQD